MQEPQVHHFDMEKEPCDDRRGAAKWAWEKLSDLAACYCQMYCAPQEGFQVSCSEGAERSENGVAGDSPRWQFPQEQLHEALSYLPELYEMADCPACALTNALICFRKLAEYSPIPPVATVHEWNGSPFDAEEIIDYRSRNNQERSYPCCIYDTLLGDGNLSCTSKNVRERALLNLDLDNLPPMPPPVLTKTKKALETGQAITAAIFCLSNGDDPFEKFAEAQKAAEAETAVDNDAAAQEEPDETLSDDDLWQILQVTPPDDTAWPDEDDRPGRGWIEWAKQEILSAPDTDRFGNCDQDELITYIVRFFRVMKAVDRWRPREIQLRSKDFGYEQGFFNACLKSGLSACDADPHFFDDAFDLTLIHGLIMREEHDTHWAPRKPSGSGWRKYLKLSFAGRKRARKASRQPDWQAKTYTPANSVSKAEKRPSAPTEVSAAAEFRDSLEPSEPVMLPWDTQPTEAGCATEPPSTQEASKSPAGSAKAHATAKVGDINIHLHLPDGGIASAMISNQANKPQQTSETEPDGVTAEAEATTSARKALQLDKCMLMHDPLAQTFDLVRLVGERNHKNLGTVVSGSQSARYDFLADAMAAGDGNTARTSKDTIKNIRKAFRERAARNGFSENFDPIETLSGERYQVKIKMFDKPDDYKPEPHQSLDVLPPMDTEGNLARSAGNGDQ